MASATLGAWRLWVRAHAAAPAVTAQAAAQRWVCPMRCLHRTYDKPGKCPVCHMDLVPVTSAMAPLPRREIWPRVEGRTAIYFRPYTVALMPVDRSLRLAGKVTADHWHLLAQLPVGESLPPLGESGMISPAEGYFRPLLCAVDRVNAAQVRVHASRRLTGFEHALLELRLPGKPSLAVPVEALQEDGAHAWVFREEGGVYKPLTVTVGERGERFVELTSGVKAGDVVAASGVFWLEAQWRLEHPEAEL
jgi:hypothetical protein